MKRIITFILATALFTAPLDAALLINEVVCNAPKDWVELFLYSDEQEQMDISPLFVTMYYGTNERLGTEAITLYSHDKTDTPWDDRFAVVHPADPAGSDESDAKGDLNGNEVRDIYCNNYFASFWNSDCVVAVDTDDDPANGGIVDFLAYSNRDGSPNSSIQSYIEYAVAGKEWTGGGGSNIQLCCLDIGPSGLEPYMAIVRKDGNDVNGMDDFAVSACQTPGRPNVLMSGDGGSGIISLLKTRILVTGFFVSESEIPLMVHRQCTVSFKLYSSTGVEVYATPVPAPANPGSFMMKWHPGQCRFKLITGLYFGKVQAVDAASDLSEEKTVFVIVGR